MSPTGSRRRDRAPKSSALLAVLFAGCGPAAEEVALRAVEAAADADVATLGRWVDPGYADPLGGLEVLRRDLADLEARYGRRRIELRELSRHAAASELHTTVVGHLDVELVGQPTWRAVGAMSLELERNAGWRVRAGLLSDLRDIMGLMDARRRALEANDPAALAALLHPRYRDGDLDREEAAQRMARDLEGVRIRLEPTNYRLELRGTTAHLDEHYRLEVAGRALPPTIARFTLGRTAGRWRILAGLYPPEAEARAPAP